MRKQEKDGLHENTKNSERNDMDDEEACRDDAACSKRGKQQRTHTHTQKREGERKKWTGNILFPHIPENRNGFTAGDQGKDDFDYDNYHSFCDFSVKHFSKDVNLQCFTDFHVMVEKPVEVILNIKSSDKNAREWKVT